MKTLGVVKKICFENKSFPKRLNHDLIAEISNQVVYAGGIYGGEGHIKNISLDTKPIHLKDGHNAPVTAIAFSHDGFIVASGSIDRTVILWDVATGCIQKIIPVSKPVFRLAFSSDCKMLAVGTQLNIVHVFDVESGEEIYTLDSESSIFSLEFSPDGKNLLFSSDNSSGIIWWLETDKVYQFGKPQIREEESFISSKTTASSFSPDGCLIVSVGEDGYAHVWDSESLELLRTIEPHGGDIYDVAFSPCGKMIATACLDRTAWVWDLHGNLLGCTDVHPEPLHVVRFIPDGPDKGLLVTGGQEVITFWDANDLM